MADRIPEIGRDLRWRVDVVQRSQTPDGVSGVTETNTVVATVWVGIEAVGAVTFWAGQQVDTPITHRITLRWLDYLDNTHAIVRATTTPDGSTRTEVFRVRRVREIEGRKRFALIEAELEKAEWVAGES